MDQTFWNKKKVLLTGHTGFKGCWLSLWLQALGAHVIGYSLPAPTTPNLFDLTYHPEDMTSYLGDVRDYDALYNVIKTEKPDIVFHLAAQALVRHSYAHPLETFATNVMGTAHLLEALRQVDCARVAVMVTSDKCYDNKEWCWGYRESEPMGGHDPYSSSKGCAELVTAAYRHSYFTVSDKASLFLASARAGNVIGGGDWAKDRLIPDFLRALYMKTPLKIRHPHAIRPWQHVLEPLSGYLLLAQQLWSQGQAFVGGWNFGPDSKDAKSVEWVANFLTQQWGEGASWECDHQDHPHEAHFLKLDISKARLQLKWKPRWSLETALTSTIDWYKAYREKQAVKGIMLEQMKAYQLS